jgi:transposase-like protein
LVFARVAYSVVQKGFSVFLNVEEETERWCLKKTQQSKLSRFWKGAQKPSTPHLYVVRPGEDKKVTIGDHVVSLSFLADLFCLFFSGSSTRDLVDHMVKKGYGFSHVTYWAWLQAISHLIYNYTLRLRPAVGNVWYSDELQVGRFWLVILSDRATHFILAARVILSRSKARLRKILRAARNLAGKCPEEKGFRTDGCPGYRGASDQEFGRNIHDYKTKEEAGGLAFTNFQEGSQRAVRARIDAMTSFHGTEEEVNDLVEGYIAYHNYVDRSPAAGNRTPAEVSAIPPLGDNPALTLLWNALAEESRIKLRHHAPRPRKTMILTRWIPAVYTMLRFLGRRRRAKRVNKRVYLDRPILAWC